MEMRYSDKQLTHIRNQAMIYQCACPAQICVALETLRNLHQQQMSCLNSNDNDVAVHERIRNSAEQTHAEMEQCLTDVLSLEGWDLETLTMPNYLHKRLLEE